MNQRIWEIIQQGRQAGWYVEEDGWATLDSIRRVSFLEHLPTMTYRELFDLGNNYSVERGLNWGNVKQVQRCQWYLDQIREEIIRREGSHDNESHSEIRLG